MINTNVGDMPLDIFADYISDILGEEWSWEYFGLIINGDNFYSSYRFGCGFQVGDFGNSDKFLIYHEIIYHIGDGMCHDCNDASGHGFSRV